MERDFSPSVLSELRLWMRHLDHTGHWDMIGTRLWEQGRRNHHAAMAISTLIAEPLRCLEVAANNLNNEGEENG